jgi:hypothetical protein
VFYELGIRHALRRRRTLLIRGRPTADQTPFDLLTDRYTSYGIDDPGASKETLVAAIRATMNGERRADSPVFELLPDLPETPRIQAVPLDFRDEVGRARAAESKGWLRLLAHEVRKQSYQRAGLHLVGKAQWDLRDYPGAKESLQAIRGTHQEDCAANLALANVYEREFRSQRRPELMSDSDRALDRVLAAADAKLTDRVEALALKGRNSKTRWREALPAADDLARLRASAMNQALRDSYSGYRQAFDQDLNHFWSGLAALQMGAILLDLAHDDGWKATFNDDTEADAYRAGVARDVAELKVMVPCSIRAALGRISSTADRVWARISEADCLFLTETNPDRVVRRYLDVIPLDHPFVWDSVRGQLDLFALVGVRVDLARRVISEVGARIPRREPQKPTRVVLFAGHRVDARGRRPARFPAEKEGRAKELIRGWLLRLGEGYQLQAFASAAPGGDIVFHEVCADLGVESKICLPIGASPYAANVFADQDDWRSRFLQLKQGRAVLELGDFSDREYLPKWLRNTKTDPWERGNQWVLQMARASGAKAVTLVALWDGSDEGDAPGGTAHMVKLARDAGDVDVKIISTSDLLT